MEQNLRRIFEVLISGTPTEFKAAKKEINRLWNKDTEEFKKHASVALEYIKRFDEIKSAKNQAAFASDLSIFFLVLADDHFETLKNFVLKLIQSPDGHVREAIRKTADWLYISLSDRIRPFAYSGGEGLTDEQKNEQKVARKQYFEYIEEIEALIDKYDNEGENIQYIDEMKPSIGKSLQLLWGEVSRREYDLVENNASEEIIAKRREIEREISEMLNNPAGAFDLDDVREAIYNEEDQGNFTDIISMFDRGGDDLELSNVLELITDAWNYFPHRALGGRCPQEIVEMHKNKK